MGDGAGVVVSDHSGNGHDGELTGGQWSTVGRFGGALTLATGDWVAVPSFPQASPSWTVSVWTYLTPADVNGQYETLISAENVFAGGWQLHFDDRPGYSRYDAAYWVGAPISDYVVLDCNCIETNVWSNLTAVFNGTAAQFTLYRNAVQVDQTEMPHLIAPGDSTLYLGRWNMNERRFSGSLDDVAIWNRALTPDEITVVNRQPPPDAE